LVRELSRRGHDVLFLEYDKPWYAANRDLPAPPYGRLGLFGSLEEFKDRFTREIQYADAVIVGSYVPDGVEIGHWVMDHARGLPVFYDIDTPVTFSRLRQGYEDYVSRELVSRYQLYLSFTGGPMLSRIESDFKSPKARPLYCSVDVHEYFPDPRPPRWDLGYLGTYSVDRQPKVNELMIKPSRRNPEMGFVVAGAQYPEEIDWGNTRHIKHLPPQEHRAFYNSQRFALNVTRQDMVVAGYSPSVRLFEAAACGTPVISDEWPGLDRFFEIGKEILVTKTAQQVLGYLQDLSGEERTEIGRRARERVLQEHTSAHRAAELEQLLLETLDEVSAWKPVYGDR
jgi:spore maturation protein CgeB